MSDAPALPTPSSEFLVHLDQNQDTPTRELLEPYLDYELWLRKAFKRDDTNIDSHANLVPIYKTHENGFNRRDIDRETADESKYIMPLGKDNKALAEPEAVASSLEEFKNNFNAFTHGVLVDLDWSNVVAAGSSALHPLLPVQTDFKQTDDESVQDPLESYYQNKAKSSDIDLFLYGLNSEEEARACISRIERQMRKNQRLFSGGAISLRSENAITLISPRYPYRHVQIILRLYKSISEVLTGFDVDCACVAFDGENVYSTPRGLTAIATRTNTIDLTRRSPSYENRLYKYRRHNFDVFWPSLDRSRINSDGTWGIEQFDDTRKLLGLARLIFFEHLMSEYSKGWIPAYQRERRDRKIEEAGEPMLTMASGYARHEVPYGERFTAEKVREYVDARSKEPHLFGTIKQVVLDGDDEASSEKLRGPVSFIKDDPGRQMIGSFHPLDAEGWTDIAYNNGDLDLGSSRNSDF